jgi:hypothetical protein
MRNIVKIGIVMLVLTGILVSCSDNSTPTPQSNNTFIREQVDLNIPEVAGIASFSPSKSYSPASKEQVDTIINAIFDEDDGFLSGLFSVNQSYGNSFSRNLSSRAVETERVQFNFSEMELDDPFMTIRGYVDALVGFDDVTEYLSVNGSAKFRLELKEGFKDEEGAYETFGVVAGQASANNVIITETTASGSISYSINGAVNVADLEAKVWVKCIFDTSLNLTLSGTNPEAKVVVNIKAYGENDALLHTYKEEQTVSLNNFMGE